MKVSELQAELDKLPADLDVYAWGEGGWIGAIWPGELAPRNERRIPVVFLGARIPEERTAERSS